MLISTQAYDGAGVNGRKKIQFFPHRFSKNSRNKKIKIFSTVFPKTAEIKNLNFSLRRFPKTAENIFKNCCRLFLCKLVICLPLPLTREHSLFEFNGNCGEQYDK